MPSDEPLTIAHNNWSFPNLSRTDLIDEANSIIEDIETYGPDDLGEHEGRVADYIRRLQNTENQTVPQLWGNGNQAVPAYMLTFLGLRNVLKPILNKDISGDLNATQRRLQTKLRAAEARFGKFDASTGALEEKVKQIEAAHLAADQLPTDLETLGEARKEISGIAKNARLQGVEIEEVLVKILTMYEDLDAKKGVAEDVLKRCETAYSAATSVGLSAAFNERSVSLSRSIWFWIGGLVVALVLGSIFGSEQVRSLWEVIGNPSTTVNLVFYNAILAIFSVAAPVWFAWLSTKQIGQRFRLAEDYAFKASVSRAYEGFRREAARIDKDMEARLLASALNRLDELPLRLVEADSHGSPWQEFASSDLVKQALKIVPGFTEQVRTLASDAINASKGQKAKLTKKTQRKMEGDAADEVDE